jgi:TatD DNase family protein
MRLIDAHCHLNFKAYQGDLEAVLGRARERGIGMITVGSQQDTSRTAVELALAHSDVWAIIGLHPIHLFRSPVDEEEDRFLSRAEAWDADRYRGLQQTAPGKVVGIGEAGLDFFHVPERVPRDLFLETQQAAFQAQIDLAAELGLPLMIHSREPGPELAGQLPSAHDELLRIIEANLAAGKSVRGNVHCFGGTIAQAERYLQAGFHISFTGTVTYKPRRKDLDAGLPPVADVVRAVPLDRLLVETDAPYLAPVPYRGERNEPAYVQQVALKIAEVKGVEADEVAATTLANTVRLFGLELPAD